MIILRNLELEFEIFAVKSALKVSELTGVNACLGTHCLFIERKRIRMRRRLTDETLRAVVAAAATIATKSKRKTAKLVKLVGHHRRHGLHLSHLVDVSMFVFAYIFNQQNNNSRAYGDRHTRSFTFLDPASFLSDYELKAAVINERSDERTSERVVRRKLFRSEANGIHSSTRLRLDGSFAPPLIPRPLELSTESDFARAHAKMKFTDLLVPSNDWNME